MRIIPSQKISAASADSADASFPASNVYDEHPKKLWKAASGVSTAVLTLTIGRENAGLAIFNTNANTIAVVVGDPNNIAWESGTAWESGVAFASLNADVTEILSLDGVSGAAWFEWAYSDSSVTAILTMTGPLGETLFAGVAVADKVYTYVNPAFGIRESMHSYSIMKELNNGAFYRKERDKVRTFSFSFLEDRPTDFYEFMYTVAKGIGYKPAAWQLTTLDGFWWVIYARFNSMPSSNHSMPNYTNINTQLIEVL